MKIILEAVVGSTTHGTMVDDGLEDLDLMAVAIEDPTIILAGEWNSELGIFVKKETWVERSKPDGVRSEAGDTDRVIYGLMKYVSLALKGNPSVLLPLFVKTGAIKTITDEGRELQGLAPSIVSKRAGSAFLGYMNQQLERMVGTRGQKNVTRPELIEKYGFDTKYAGHVIRLGFQGIELMQTGSLSLPMSKQERDMVVDIRTGMYSFDHVVKAAGDLISELRLAREKSQLPEQPDVEFVKSWAVKRYLQAWGATPQS